MCDDQGWSFGLLWCRVCRPFAYVDLTHGSYATLSVVPKASLFSDLVHKDRYRLLLEMFESRRGVNLIRGVDVGRFARHCGRLTRHFRCVQAGLNGTEYAEI